MSRDIFNQIRFLRAPSNLALNVSRDGASPISLGSQGQWTAPALPAFPHSRGAPALGSLLWPPLAPLQQVQVYPVDAGLPGEWSRGAESPSSPCCPCCCGCSPGYCFWCSPGYRNHSSISTNLSRLTYRTQNSTYSGNLPIPWIPDSEFVVFSASDLPRQPPAANQGSLGCLSLDG